ncbi:MAG: ParA family protein [Proteobacteria bacterium]|nr:ParA family protein [Pseudomonadota bacterium]
MSVICFGSLKGGVGKTSVSVNIAHAFAQRGCQTLLIDLDPVGHATRFFNQAGFKIANESPLARLFLACNLEEDQEKYDSLVEAAITHQVPLMHSVREGLALIPSGPELRHFLWGRGARALKLFFSRLIRELNSSYDCIIFDTAPDFNIITRNAIAAADLVCVPVDSSAMSIHSMEEFITSASHIKNPSWSIIRTMVTKQASQMQKLTEDRLQKNLSLSNTYSTDDLESEDDFSASDSRVDRVIDISNFHSKVANSEVATSQKPDDSPIYLLNSIIYRSEQQNKLSFLGKTAFDSKAETPLKTQYENVAKELENILTISDEEEEVAVNEDRSFPLEMLNR